MISDKAPKKWKTKATYNIYEDASEIKNLLLDNDDTGKLEVKIKRCGPDGRRFKIKTHYPEPEKKQKKK
jgi:hypothetical protein|tara:strand:- start:125 stop:331 length:207 start_codon:yes stop_codon:yes gene_type:complete